MTSSTLENPPYYISSRVRVNASGKERMPADSSPPQPLIFFVGDPHGEYDHVVEMTHLYKPDAVVFLGDMDLVQPLDVTLKTIYHITAVWWIHGNHDCDHRHADMYRHLFHSKLGNRSLHGRVVEIAGLRVAGLGGVFRGKIWDPRRGAPLYATRDAYVNDQPTHRRRENAEWGELPLTHHGTIWHEDYVKLQGFKAHILVTHEAPSSHPHGYTALDELATSLGAHTILHGHHHQSYEGQVGKSRVHGVRQAGIVTQRGDVIW